MKFLFHLPKSLRRKIEPQTSGCNIGSILELNGAQCGEITIGTRDGAAHVLRCLKVWYEQPNDVLFAAINLVDRFLTKMKVRPKHMACISVSSFYLAVKQYNGQQLDADHLVAISQVSFVFHYSYIIIATL